MKRLLPLISAVLLTPAAVHADDLRINGFMNVTAGLASTDEIDANGYDDDVSFDQQTLMGLQFLKTINDKTSATVQLVARGKKEFAVESSWLYFTYAADDNTDIRMGRMRTPTYQYSDFLEVGYAYNWVSPPDIIYVASEFSSFNGLDVTRRFNAGITDASVQAYYGRNTSRFSDGNDEYVLESNPTYGVVFSANHGDFTGRASVHITDVFLQLDPTGTRGLDQYYAGALFFGLGDDFTIEDTQSSYYQMSFTWDNGSTMAVVEWTGLEHETALFNDNQAYMVGGAQRLGNKTVHLTYAERADELESGAVGQYQSFAEIEESSIILGLRWDYDSSTALKFEAEHNDEKKTGGAEGESGMIYRIGMALVF